MDPGPPTRMAVPGDGTGAVERQLGVQVTACLQHDPQLLRAIPGAAGSGGGGGGLSVQRLSDSFALRDGSGGGAIGNNTGLEEVGAALWPGARPWRWRPPGDGASARVSASDAKPPTCSVQQQQRRRRQRRRSERSHGGGGGGVRDGGDSYDPDADADFSDAPDVVVEALSEALDEWQQRAAARRVPLPRGAPVARLQAGQRARRGSGGGKAGGGASVPAGWLDQPGERSAAGAGSVARALRWGLPWKYTQQIRQASGPEFAHPGTGIHCSSQALTFQTSLTDVRSGLGGSGAGLQISLKDTRRRPWVGRRRSWATGRAYGDGSRDAGLGPPTGGPRPSDDPSRMKSSARPVGDRRGA
eukprot:358164-Chlamydomonas_euryale.AAC.2